MKGIWLLSLRQTKIPNLSILLFLISTALLPLQLNKFIWLPSSYVLGIPTDYLALSFYLSDLAITSYIIAFPLQNFEDLKKFIKEKKNLVLTLLIFNLYLFLSLPILKIPTPSLIFSIKILEFSLFTIFAAISLSKTNVAELFKKVLLLSIFWQIALITAQFILGRSLGFNFLGERSFDSQTPAIAHIEFLGSLFLRPYGTFPHPNVAAAFILIAYLIVEPSIAKFKKYSAFCSLAIIFLGLILTFSKSAIFALFVSTLFLVKNMFKSLIFAAIFLIILAIFFKTLSDFQAASIAERFQLAQASLEIFAKNPLFGAGASQFIPEIARLDLYSISQIRLLQPVHNLFLLILAENGLLGLAIFTAFLFQVAKNARDKQRLAIFVSLMIFASFDHFLWTLAQGRLLFALSVAFILSEKTSA